MNESSIFVKKSSFVMFDIDLMSEPSEDSIPGLINEEDESSCTSGNNDQQAAFEKKSNVRTTSTTNTTRSAISPPTTGPQCDACSYCDDVCELRDCKSCQEKRRRIKEENSNDSHHSGLSRTNNSRKYYTMCQVRRHNNMKSAWLIAGDSIYDATSYIECHPGGQNSILKRSGGAKDCTEDLNFHSGRAQKVWKKHRIGTLKPCYGCMAEEDKFPFLATASTGDQCIIC
eukprot:CAMPEP_0178949934 /NCGR_PEP_ID=MMETSP0789-20121207/6348_1 /TAXON_ID=3005 /ORGANISM="Rhizosolenia setigera, Strain CCMP 1694" /LENGTH=228 /DNA_ID=CAMNT_0020630555 /DNA_START=51 /DNA_END=737 /DNA_ORIENTATION=+